MKKKVLVLFKSTYSTLKLDKNDKKNLEKNFYKTILYEENFGSDLKSNTYYEKKLRDIKDKYESLNIKLDIEKIFRINFFLENIKLNYSNMKIFICPYFISGIINEEEFIFFELSQLHGMQFLRPEMSFIKNRFILAKNLLKNFYELTKKTKFSETKFKKFKKNYIFSLNSFSKDIEKKENKLLNLIKNFFFILIKLIYKFKFNKKSKKYALLILGNDMNLGNLVQKVNIKKFVLHFFKKFDYDLVLLVHPNSNLFDLLKSYIKNDNIFFKNKRIIFTQKPESLIYLVENSEFVVHLTSSLSAQMLLYDKHIICLGKNIIYLSFFNNLISKFNNHKFKYLSKKISLKNIFHKNRFFKEILTNSVDNKGRFYLSINKHFYSILQKRNEKKIVINLLNAV